MNQCLKCQKNIGEEEGLFCSDICGKNYVNTHFQYSKTITDSTEQGYKVICKSCEKVLKTISDITLDDNLIKELNNHLPSCSHEKPKGGSKCCTCKKSDSDADFKEWIAEGGYTGFCSKACEDDWINKYGESDSMKVHYKNKPRKEQEERDKPKPNKPKPVNLGKDYANLKPAQQEGRKTTDIKWKEFIKKEKVQKSFACPYCQQYINWNKSQEDYIDARQLALQALESHKQSCSLKSNPTEGKKKQQEQWDKIRSKKLANQYSCQKCWGKIKWDITIADAETAKKQALADWNKHQKEECGSDNKTIAIYFSPNQGGNQHAPLNFLPSEEVPIEHDNSLIEEQTTENNNSKEQPTNYLPWIIGVGLVLVLIGTIVYFINKKKKK